MTPPATAVPPVRTGAPARGSRDRPLLDTSAPGVVLRATLAAEDVAAGERLGVRHARRTVGAVVGGLALLLVLVDAVVVELQWPLALFLAVASLAGLALRGADERRRRRLAVAAVSASVAGTAVMAVTVLTADGVPVWSASFGLVETAALLLLLVALCRAAVGRREVALAVAAGAAVTALPLRSLGLDTPVLMILLAASVAVAVAVGMTLRTQDARRELAVTAVRQAERESIARELHDVVAHHVTGIVVATQAARTVAARRPEDVPAEVPAALGAIEEAGTEALAAMRRLVGVLRTDLGADAPRLPTAGLADVTEMVERFRAAGAAHDVGLRLPPPDGAPVPAEVQAAVYRVVQESLTNIARHAGGARRVTVRIDRSQEALVLEVVNSSGTAPASQTGARGAEGFGLLGMRERVEALGGSLTAGWSDGGWAVRASVPCAVGERRAP